MDLVQRIRYNKKGKIWYETWPKELDYRGKMRLSEATQSLASFVMRGMHEPLYCEMGADYGDDPLV